MLKIDIEYKKGILFVRLIGDVNKSTIKDMEIVDNMIVKAGIKYLLINLEKVTIIIPNEISKIINKYKKLIGDDGKIVICGYYNPMNLSINTESEKVYISGQEKNAFNIINI